MDCLSAAGPEARSPTVAPAPLQSARAARSPCACFGEESALVEPRRSQANTERRTTLSERAFRRNLYASLPISPETQRPSDPQEPVDYVAITGPMSGSGATLRLLSVSERFGTRRA